MTDLSQTDRDALARSIEVTRRESPARSKQLDAMLRDPSRSWLQVGRFACSCAQTSALHLPPWQPPPCWVTDIDRALDADDDEPRRGWNAAGKLLQKMLALGISRFEPNPPQAIAEAEQRKAG